MQLIPTSHLFTENETISKVQVVLFQHVVVQPKTLHVPQQDLTVKAKRIVGTQDLNQKERDLC